MPVIEVDHILDYQHNGRLHEYNILLLWSIFFAAVNVSRPLVTRGLASTNQVAVCPSECLRTRGI